MRPQWGAIHRKAGLRMRGLLFSLSLRNKNRHTKSLITTGLTEAQAIGRRIGILSPEFLVRRRTIENLLVARKLLTRRERLRSAGSLTTHLLHEP